MVCSQQPDITLSQNAFTESARGRKIMVAHVVRDEGMQTECNLLAKTRPVGSAVVWILLKTAVHAVLTMFASSASGGKQLNCMTL